VTSETMYRIQYQDYDGTWQTVQLEKGKQRAQAVLEAKQEAYGVQRWRMSRQIR